MERLACHFAEYWLLTYQIGNDKKVKFIKRVLGNILLSVLVTAGRAICVCVYTCMYVNVCLYAYVYMCNGMYVCVYVQRLYIYMYLKRLKKY